MSREDGRRTCQALGCVEAAQAWPTIIEFTSFSLEVVLCKRHEREWYGAAFSPPLALVKEGDE